MDIFFDENTSEQELCVIVDRFKNCKDLDKIGDDIIASNETEIDTFLTSLELTLKRQIDYIFVLPLHGKEMRFTNPDSAVSFIEEYDIMPNDAVIDRYVVGIFYSDGTQINCVFRDKARAIDFLKREAGC